MFSWKLWRELKHPPTRHPLMYRNYSNNWLTRLRDRVIPCYLSAMLLGTAYLIWRITPHISHTLGFIFFLLVLIIPMTATLVLLTSPLLFPVVIIGTGALWASRISEHVTRQQEIGFHDLLCVLPGGRWAANWATACGSIHQSDIFEVIWFILRGMLTIGLLLVMGFSMIMGQIISEDTELVNLGWFVLDMATLFVGYALHYTQSMALSPLVGLLVPTYIHNRFEARTWSAGLYLVIQIGSYVLGGLLFYFLPLVVGGVTASIRIVTPYLVMVFILREVLIGGLWMVLLRRLNLTMAEKAAVWKLV